MLDALHKAGSGQFSQRITLPLPDGTLTTVQSGRFDLGSESWEMTQTFVSSSDTMRAQTPELTKLQVDARIANHRMYMTMPGWPEKIRGRWLAFEVDDTGASAAAGVDAGGVTGYVPRSVSALLALKPTSIVPSATGWTLSGEIPAPIALSWIGLDSALTKRKIDITAIAGTASMTVAVARDGTPASASLSGRAIDLGGGSALPADLHSAVRTEQVDVDFSKFGEPVKVAAPAVADLIDPSEMNP